MPRSAGRRRGISAGQQVEQIELFPILSVLLCVVGVLALIQFVAGFLGRPGLRLRGSGDNGDLHPYQIVCTQSGVTLIPPSVDGPAFRALKLVAERDREAVILRAQERRCLQLDQAAVSVDRAMDLSEGGIEELFKEIQAINQAARKHHLPYEEFLIFAIVPGGGAQYHRFRSLLNHAEYVDIQYGLVPIDPGTKLDLSRCQRDE